MLNGGCYPVRPTSVRVIQQVNFFFFFFFFVWKSKMSLTQQRVRELFDYDPETGVMTRRITPSARAKKGEIAGYDDGKGYLQVSIAGKKYRLHRLVWFWVHGVWPKNDVDHRDRNRSNNRIKNLMAATRAENCHNAGLAAHNTSGFKGVSWSKNMNKWEARITLNDCGKVLGYFDTPEQASAAYLAAKPAYHPTAPI